MTARSVSATKGKYSVKYEVSIKFSLDGDRKLWQ
jgi:hypothetical protein